MNKKLAFKATAVLVCCGILLLAVPNAALAKKTPKRDAKFLKNTVQAVATILPIFNPMFKTVKNLKANKKVNRGKLIKVGGTAPGSKVSDGD